MTAPAEGPATVTLTDDEREALREARETGPWSEVRAVVERIVAARVAALTADLAAARAGAVKWKQRSHDHAQAAHRREVERDAARHHAVTAQARIDAAEQVIANIRALADQMGGE